MKRKSQKGVALVITLILLSVITFMAVTFLVVSRHEAAGVGTLAQQTAAKNAADAALAQATGTLVSRVVTATNGLYSVLTVSTNYVQPFFNASGNPAGSLTSLTNVSYYDSSGNLLQGAAMQQMLGNLEILPRAPVFVTSNKTQVVPDFRFYLDLNRNGVYDANGPVVEHDPNGLAGSVITNYYTGDPEWVGILSHPDQPHSSSNQFIGRYCYIILPMGNSLDVNYANNQNKVLQPGGPAVTQDGFIRNQGVGSWEINVAAFLGAVNANTWWYNYRPTDVAGNIAVFPSGGSPPTGMADAFLDAASILQFRYNTSYLKLSSFGNLFGGQAVTLLGNEFIDGYGAGPLMLGANSLAVDNDRLLAKTTSWSGDDCPNPYFTTQDLFVPNSFSNSLYRAGRNYSLTASPSTYSSTNSYNRYTFYRLLSQMGVASAPEPAPYPISRKLNLNYKNVNGFSATNFVAWQPIEFFTNTANALLAQAGYPFNVANIEIYPVNQYTPAVHRLLQLAANIYDASTNKGMSLNNSFAVGSRSGFDFPSVFRPMFRHNGTNVFINGYVEDTPPSISGGKSSFTGNDYALPDDLTLFTALPATIPANANVSVYGVPWVIGARKGLPNFNEFSMQSIAQVTRKLQVVYGKATNIQYTIGVSNQIGVEAWNSYIGTYSNAIDLVGLNSTTMCLSNDIVGVLVTPQTTSYPWSYALPSWPGRPVNLANSPSQNRVSFQIPLMTNYIFLPDSVYHPNSTPHFTSSTNFDTGILNPLKQAPHFILFCTNRLRFVLVDHATQRVLDYVHFDLNGTNFTRDLTAELQGLDNGAGNVWATNIYNNTVLQGVYNQLMISEGLNPPGGFNPNGWTSDTLDGKSKPDAISSFASLMAGSLPIGTTMQAPYTPTRKTGVYYTWQANDPLVHYTLSDLTPMPPVQTNVTVNYNMSLTGSTNLPNIGFVNQRYLPWKNTGNSKIPDVNSVNLAVKDPQVNQSDDWQFPTNKFPNIGWLGRVHRGTPWQTVYLKSTAVDLTNWQTWTGNNTIVFSNGVQIADAAITTPTNDWKILDLFTAAPNDNASRGQWSVNGMSVNEGSQSNLSGFAGWSAVLDGVFVLSNSPTGAVPICIDPTNLCTVPGTGLGTNTLQYLVSRINAVRGTNTGGVFTNVGQILSVPELTVASPYINTNATGTAAANLTDAVYERIPQQIMSLLRTGTPRYVVYAYGQSLQPAPHSAVQSGQYLGMITNYQITGEVATRTVVRIENFPVPVPPGQTSTNLAPRAVVESFNVLPPGN